MHKTNLQSRKRSFFSAKDTSIRNSLANLNYLMRLVCSSTMSYCILLLDTLMFGSLPAQTEGLHLVV